MVRITVSIACSFFILAIFFIITSVNSTSHNNTEAHSTLNSYRQKRELSDVPDVIKVVLKENRQIDRVYTFEKVEPILVNEHVPVWISKCNGFPEWKHEAKEIMGDLVMYQDVIASSAIVYIKSTKSIFGSFGTDFYIRNASVLNSKKNLVWRVEDEHILINPNRNIHGATFRRLSDEFMDRVPSGFRKLSYPDSWGFVAKLDKKYYIEILLLITNDIVIYFQTLYGDDYFKELLIHYVAIFNSADMMFAKMKADFRIYLNLAGLIVEEDPNVFSHTMNIEDLQLSQRYQVLNTDRVFERLPNHFFNSSDPLFPNNSYDIVILTTRRQLISKDQNVLGVTSVCKGIYSSRLRSEDQMRNIPKIITATPTSFNTFGTIGHEIGHVLGSQAHDSREHGPYVNTYQCYSIMQKKAPICTNCLRWSPESINRIEKFLRYNQYPCWFLNYPRSLSPYDQPKVYRTTEEQCQCYGYETNNFAQSDSENFCEERLSCQKTINGELYNASTIFPYDGTPCSSDDPKVCWKSKCVDIATYAPKVPLTRKKSLLSWCL